MATAQLYLDTRRAKADGTFPIKIRINNIKKVWLLKTIYSESESDFKKILKGGGNNEDIKSKHEILTALVSKAKTIINEITPFDYNTFQTRFFKRGDRLDLILLLKEKAENLTLLESYGNAKLYEQAGKLFLAYLTNIRKDSINLNEVTPKFLKAFEVWAMSLKNKKNLNKYSSTSLSMYLIRVRAIFNDAISEQIVPSNIYPFHTAKNNKGYKIPKACGNKRALSIVEIKSIFDYVPATDSEAMAKDFFLFSYLASGINAIDIFKLKWTDINAKTFTFIRKKTANKTGGRNEITIPLNGYLLDIIKRQGSKKIGNDYVFNIFKSDATEKQKLEATRSKISVINVNLKKIAIKIGITPDISTYYARHSFSQSLLNSEAPLALISQQLGHTSLKTTESYLGKFSTEKTNDYLNADSLLGIG
jgi:integrase/recombinase XerD